MQRPKRGQAWNFSQRKRILKPAQRDRIDLRRIALEKLNKGLRRCGNSEQKRFAFLLKSHCGPATRALFRNFSWSNYRGTGKYLTESFISGQFEKDVASFLKVPGNKKMLDFWLAAAKKDFRRILSDIDLIAPLKKWPDVENDPNYYVKHYVRTDLVGPLSVIEELSDLSKKYSSGR